MKKTYLYYHGGSANHGCEAIVRSTAKLLNTDLTLYTTDLESDRRYSLQEIVTLREDTCRPLPKGSLKWLSAALDHKKTGKDYLFVKYAREDFFSQVDRRDVYLSIGGDNYCYPGQDILGYYNRAIHEKGGKTVLWGCSVEPELVKDPAIAADLARYDLIAARETISFNALQGINPHTILTPDPAFFLERKDLPLPENFAPGNTVGINVSPLIMKSEKTTGITEENYRALVEYILRETDFRIALIPHVVEPGNDDREPLHKLYELYQGSGRLVEIPDCNAMELKGYIARCRMFVGARTHATIAAYSTGVPTLVVGYSVKARGIARDLMGCEEHHVLPVQSLAERGDLTDAFRWLMEHEEEIRHDLEEKLPEYRAPMDGVLEKIRGMM